MDQDMQLLRQYARDGSQAAFTELVSRHIDWIYSVCRRRVRDQALAQDVTQAVFIVLAKKAKELPDQTVLSGWLMQVAKYASADAMKKRSRQQKHEQRAAMARSGNQDLATPTDAPELMTQVDEAMAKLNKADRDALALRFYRQQSLAEVAVSLGITEEAAKKRVQRGLQRLRSILGKPATSITATALAGMMLSTAAQAAPIQLQQATVVTAITAKSGAALSIAKGAMSLMSWAKVQIVAAIVGSSVVVATVASAAVYQQSHTTPLNAPVPTAAVPVVAASQPVIAPIPAPTTRAIDDDDSFVLDGGAGFSRKLDRRLLRFTHRDGAFKQFHLAASIAALPVRGDVASEAIIERDGDRVALLVRSMSERLPYAIVADGLLLMLDPQNPSGILAISGVQPQVLIGAQASVPGAAMTQITLRAAEEAKVNVDLASLIEQLQTEAAGRNFETRFSAVRLNRRDAGGRVVLALNAKPDEPPVRQFNVSETVRLSLGLTEINTGATAVQLTRLSSQGLDASGLSIRWAERTELPADLIPEVGLFRDAARRATAEKFRAWLERNASKPQNNLTRPR